MKQIVLSIDESKFGFFLELIRHFDFIRIEESEPSHKEIKEKIRKEIKEVELIERDEMAGTSLNHFIDEL